MIPLGLGPAVSHVINDWALCWVALPGPVPGRVGGLGPGCLLCAARAWVRVHVCHDAKRKRHDQRHMLVTSIEMSEKMTVPMAPSAQPAAHEV